MSMVLLPETINRAAIPIVTLAEVRILVIADLLFFDGAVVVAVLFHGVIALIAHGQPPMYQSGSKPVP